jgi:hypothetical protein
MQIRADLQNKTRNFQRFFNAAPVILFWVITQRPRCLKSWFNRNHFSPFQYWLLSIMMKRFQLDKSRPQFGKTHSKYLIVCIDLKKLQGHEAR